MARIAGLLVDTAPLRESLPFRRLWVSQMCSSFGSQMTAVAVLFQVWRSTGSTVWTGAIDLAQAVPLIAFGLFAGALADRLDRRRLYRAATAGQGACSALLALQAMLGTFPVGVVLLVIGVQSLCGAGSGPTARTFLPHLVPAQRLAAALALNRIAFQGAMMVGPATISRSSSQIRSMQPSGRTRPPPEPAVTDHTTAPLNRDARSVYTLPTITNPASQPLPAR